MIDLHMHSKYSSDGIEEVSDMLKMAEDLNLKCISITDHNDCRAYKDLKVKEIRYVFSGKIITGVELNTKALSIPIEILGYNIDPEKMTEEISKNYPSNIERNKIELKRLYEKCIKANIKLPDDFVQKYDGSIYASKYLYQFITKNEDNKKFFNENSWKDSNVFYREYMSNPKTLFYVDMEDVLPDLKEACKMIRNCGGIVSIPHIYEYRENSVKILEYIINELIDIQEPLVDGLECYYRNFTKEQTDYLLNICEKYNLIVSGGSDYHGRVKPHIKMGVGEGNLNVPDEIINNWKDIKYV